MLTDVSICPKTDTDPDMSGRHDEIILNNAILVCHIYNLLEFILQKKR